MTSRSQKSASPSSIKQPRRLSAAVASGLVAMVLAACSSSNLSDSASTTSGAAKSVGTLTVAVAVSNPLFAQPYIALNNGYFKQHGLTVKIIDNAGANTTNLVASGQADLGMIGAASPLLMAKQGLDTKIIYSHVAGGSGGCLVTSTKGGVTSVSQLKDKRLGTLSLGSSTYGDSVIYNKNFHLNANIVPFQQASSILAAVETGQVAGANAACSTFTQALQQGQLKLLIDTRNKAERQNAFGAAAELPEAAVFGLQKDLSSKKAAVDALMEGMLQAAKFIDSNSDSRVATVLRKSTVFGEQSQEVVTGQVTDSRPYWLLDAGDLKASQWKACLQFFASWGLSGYSPTDSIYSYNQRVDMSYFDTATKALGINTNS